MTGAMYAAIGGLKTHMTKLNVIGNNLANVNTYGYKAQRMTFRESIYATNKSGSDGTTIMGGNNPSQIGYGCTVGSIDLNMSPSTYSPTGFGLDCMLTGEGFFLVGDKVNYTTEEVFWVENEDGTLTRLEEGEEPPQGANVIISMEVKGKGITSASELTTPYLTRVGDFWVDADGYICNRDNQVLYGFARVQNPNYIPEPTKQQLEYAARQKPPIDIESPTIISTELVPLRVPLSAAAPTDENGGIAYVPEDPDDPDSEMIPINLWEEGDPVYPYLRGADDLSNTYAYSADQRPAQNRYGINDTEDDAAGGGAGGGTDTTEGLPDPTYYTQIAVAHNANENSVSSELPVQMKSMSIGTDGAITGTVNGQTVVIGYVAIASADSPDGVTNMGGPYYKAMGGAGNLRISCLRDLGSSYLGNKTIQYYGADAGDDLAGKVMSTPSAADRIMLDSGNSVQNGGLEASNVDVATEFAEMITAQRGYQVNTRIISVTDSMLEELANMKR